MKISEIEDAIACNELTASQVFSQMKQHIYNRETINMGWINTDNQPPEDGQNVAFVVKSDLQPHLTGKILGGVLH